MNPKLEQGAPWLKDLTNSRFIQKEERSFPGSTDIYQRSAGLQQETRIQVVGLTFDDKVFCFSGLQDLRQEDIAAGDTG
jgi:hypothetical protein